MTINEARRVATHTLLSSSVAARNRKNKQRHRCDIEQSSKLATISNFSNDCRAVIPPSNLIEPSTFNQSLNIGMNYNRSAASGHIRPTNHAELNCAQLSNTQPIC
jgi:hypothetical protein